MGKCNPSVTAQRVVRFLGTRQEAGGSLQPLLEKVAAKARATVESLQVIIAGAGGAAHLPGMVAALTPLPVVGVPVKPQGAHLDGLDALLSIVQVVPTL
jgi:phosphoribosylaminoimidazole carboxylase PurE protein